MSEYKSIEDLPIVNKLNNKKKEGFIHLLNTYGNILDQGPELKEIGFTPHDLSHHIKDILDLYGKLNLETFYQGEYSACENLYILLVATLFHDYGMTQEWNNEVRNRHSDIGKKMFLEECSNDTTVLAVEVPYEIREYIADIIYAHSDTKNPTEETFLEVCDKYENNNVISKWHEEEINVPLLAAILRLADELDITYKRIERTQYEKHNNLLSSIEHFHECVYFKSVDLGRHKDTIYISVNEDIKEKLNSIEKIPNGEKIELATNAAQILNRYKKIKGEFRLLNEKVFSRNIHSDRRIWMIRDIVLNDEDKLVLAAKKKRNVLPIASIIKECVFDTNALMSGHFWIDDERSARDWIDIEKLVYDKNCIFTQKLLNNEDIADIIEKKDVLLGLNHFGAICAAMLGYHYGKPFAYVFDNNKLVDDIEREIDNIDSKNILIIIDVVVSGKTLSNTIDVLLQQGIIDMENGVDAMILFERKYQTRKRYEIRNYDLSPIYAKSIIKNIYVLNDDFDIEICRKNRNDCKLKCNHENVICIEEKEE